MKIVSLRAIDGPNKFHAHPVLVLTLDLGEWAEVASDEIDGFLARLNSCLPGLREHTCSPGRAGGFLERLARGTYPAHIIEHIALELSSLAGIGVKYGKTIFAGKQGLYDIVTTYRNEPAMMNCLETAVQIFLATAREVPFDLDSALAEIRNIAEAHELGPSGRALMSAAASRGIPVRRIGRESLLELGYGKYRRRLQAAVSDRTSLISTELVQDKAVTKSFLKMALVPVPSGFVARTESELVAGLESLRPPWVIKPVDGHHGQGVTLNLETIEDAKLALIHARKFSTECVVESMVCGRDYRLLVVGKKLIAAGERKPAHVIGDGLATVEQLIEQANLDPRRGDGHCNVLTKISIDDDVHKELATQELKTDSVPSVGRYVRLRGTANISTGGTAGDVTDIVHPEIRCLSERIARLVDLDICGIDLIHSDIRRPPDSDTAVIEVNAGPGLRMHISPSDGRPRDIAGYIVESMYPDGSLGRIPIISITGTNGKTTTTRLVGHILSVSGLSVGQTTSEGISIGGRLVARGDTTGPLSAKTVLHDPSVEVAVLETARGGITRSGLGYDWSDVGIITNVRPDHFGQDGIESIDDLLHIKSLVAERVRAGGTLILNADDEASASVASREAVRRIPKTYIYYSLNAENTTLQRHLAAGGRGFVVRDGLLLESWNGEETVLAQTEELAFAFHGTADFQVSNALAACAAARVLNVDPVVVREALASFRASELNLGRASVYRVREGYVVLDYGHNQDAIAAVAATARKWNPSRLVGVLGLPGDRSDELLQDCARVAAEMFDSLLLREDVDLRGRKSGEVPELMARVAVESSPQKDLRVHLDTKTAMKDALENMRPGEVVVVFYEKLDEALSVLRAYDPQPEAGRVSISKLQNTLHLTSVQERNFERGISTNFPPPREETSLHSRH